MRWVRRAVGDPRSWGQSEGRTAAMSRAGIIRPRAQQGLSSNQPAQTKSRCPCPWQDKVLTVTEEFMCRVGEKLLGCDSK